jgi:PAS domain S-box-containing protein
MPSNAALLDTLFANAPVGLAFWDTDLRFRRVNATLASINGLGAEDHIGRTLQEVLPELGDMVAGWFREILATGRPRLNVEVSGETPARPGVTRQWLASYYPVTDKHGQMLGIGAVVLEVTAQRAAEEERLKLAREALTSRAVAEAALVRAESSQEEAEAARAAAEAAGRRMAFLAGATARMSASMDYETTLRAVVREAVPAIADWSAITMVEPGGRLSTLAVAHAVPALEALAWEFSERYPPRAGDEVGVPRVLRTGRTELIAEITNDVLAAIAHDDEHLRLLTTLGLRSSLVVPLRTPERLLGAFTLMVAESGRRFDDADVALAEALASRAALAVENARLYTERSHIAHTLQRSLLPERLPEIPGMDIAAHYRAAGDQNEVGGDFYDVFPSRDGAWTALIGDVSGKGPEAAAITSLSRHTLRAAALRDGTPVENLTLLNDALLNQADSGLRFCTVLYARLCPGENEALLTLSNGGHLPALLVRPGGAVEEIAIPGTLVGALREPRFQERDVHLGPGELLLLYTDGVVELRGEDATAGERRLREVLAAHAGEPAAAVVEAVARMAVERQAGEPRDDIALLALRVAP